MQCFLPYPDFAESARVLDNRRLGKQRVEVLQILKTLKQGPYKDGKKTPWYNHPAVKMWARNIDSLVEYGLIICLEWKERGFNDTCYDKIGTFFPDCDRWTYDPAWLGNDRFHLSHQVALFVKDPQHYSKYFGWFDSDTINYHWPSKE